MQNSNSNAGTNVPTSTTADELPSSQTIAKPNVICCYYFIVKRDDKIIEELMSDNELYIKSEISALKSIYSKYKNCHFWYGVLNSI